MKKKTIVTRLSADGKLRRVNPDGTLTLVRIKTIPELPDDFVEAAARTDPDNPPLTKDRLAAFHRVPRVQTLRWNLGLSQEEFAKHYAIPLGTLRDWERGRTEPDSATSAYLEVIAHDPERVREILREALRKPSSRSHRRRSRASA